VTEPGILILGIGNLLWADEGFGVRCVETLDARWVLPERVTVLDGGTQGLYLLPFVEAAAALIVFDAIDYGLPPGTLRTVRDDAVPAFMGAKKLSLHQTGFQDVIATAELRGRRPPAMLLIGVQPLTLEDYGGGLTPPVAAQVGPAVEIALAELSRVHRIHPVARSTPSPGLSAPPVARAAYEGGRPDGATAFRAGDARFINLLSETP
jgi:hydrogenase maturation protease